MNTLQDTFDKSANQITNITVFLKQHDIRLTCKTFSLELAIRHADGTSSYLTGSEADMLAYAETIWERYHDSFLRHVNSIVVKKHGVVIMEHGLCSMIGQHIEYVAIDTSSGERVHEYANQQAVWDHIHSTDDDRFDECYGNCVHNKEVA